MILIISKMELGMLLQLQTMKNMMFIRFTFMIIYICIILQKIKKN